MQPVPAPKTETLEDGCILVSIGEGDEMVSGIVSSMHLVETKLHQLERAYLDQ